ncbi:MAG: enoyl-CoA hydratase/isomerase family protein [Candidatus Bathyarchaeota archaeon]
MFKNIIFEKSGVVAKIIINRPRVKNALDEETTREVVEALKNVEFDENVKIVIISGAGGSFSAGADFSQLQIFHQLEPAEIKRRIDFFHLEVIHRIANLPKITIAVVDGDAAGAGFCIALACDFIIASENARFSQIFSRIGLIQDSGATFFLPKIIGLLKAKELILTGDIIGAYEAEKIGLVNKVVPKEKLEEEVNKLVEKLVKNPGKALSLAKMVLNMGISLDLKSTLNLESTVQSLCLKSEEHLKIVKEFLERRRSKEQA